MVNEGGNQKESSSVKFNCGRTGGSGFFIEWFDLESKSGFMTLNLTPMYTTQIRNKTDSDIAIMFIVPSTVGDPVEVDTVNGSKVNRYPCGPEAYSMNIPAGDGVTLPRNNATGSAYSKAILYWN